MNKKLLIDCAYDYYLQHDIPSNHSVICSGYMKQIDEIRPAMSKSGPEQCVLEDIL